MINLTANLFSLLIKFKTKIKPHYLKRKIKTSKKMHSFKDDIKEKRNLIKQLTYKIELEKERLQTLRRLQKNNLQNLKRRKKTTLSKQEIKQEIKQHLTPIILETTKQLKNHVNNNICRNQQQRNLQP